MMGPTHLLGGAALLALTAIATDTTDVVPAWAYGLAAISGLVPDADNPGGAMVNRPIFLPLKWSAFPCWKGAAHRTRSHSFVATAMYTAIITGCFYVVGLLFSSLGDGGGPNLTVVAMAAATGYLSHLLLDLLNIPGEMLLWPIPARIFFPPWRAHGFVPGRFNTSTRWEHFLVNLPLTIFLCWFAFDYTPDIAAATVESIRGLIHALGGFITGLIDYLQSGG